uniref:NADH dehydrogenase subunit 3 n=1 Tax=Magnusiomyces fungicola TaxID=1734004 RepID=UPI001BED91F0|nr:NADH dehydrogenase subunit 3 [Saprochaete fungicola]QUV75101.1 NADH dehydrogenase subunit 3 [Saprochaete fungicola]
MFNISTTTAYIFIAMIPTVGTLTTVVNITFSETNTYADKTGPFECGTSSFTQTRIAFTVSFITIAITFTPFDTEVTSITPYSTAMYHTNSYGTAMFMIFIATTSTGFAYEINSKATYIAKHHIKNKSDRTLTTYT